MHVIGISYVMWYLLSGCSQEERGAGGAEGAEQGGPAAGRHGEDAGGLQVVHWLQVPKPEYCSCLIPKLDSWP